MSRGFACIALDNPKTMENVGGVLRAAACYGVAQVIMSGTRLRKGIRHGTNTSRAERHMPVLRLDDVLGAVPFDTQVVAVDLIDGAIPLPSFCHPERALYVFGAEDATLGRRITDRAQHVVYIPTRACMNLSACVNVLLYDRLVKRGAPAAAYAKAAA
jgi:tRNA(Leu) C34 or U34 (ribose-2'-O)-methylase TrmL